MEGKNKKELSSAKDVLLALSTDSGAKLCQIDSSSDEEDLLQLEQDPDNSSYTVQFSQIYRGVIIIHCFSVF